jgi:hypothetical protein
MDRGIEQLANRYPEIPVLRTVPGVGPLIAAAYVLTLDRPDAVQHRGAEARNYFAAVVARLKKGWIGCRNRFSHGLFPQPL